MMFMKKQEVVMKNYFLNYARKFISTITILALIFAGCSKETVNGPEKEAPVLPPLGSFKMDFSDFVSLGSMEKNAVVLSKNNWTFAAVNVGIWNTIIAVGLVIPTGAFVATIDQDKEPIQLEDGTWVWTAEFQATKKYTANLHGKVTFQKLPRLLWGYTNHRFRYTSSLSFGLFYH